MKVLLERLNFISLKRQKNKSVLCDLVWRVRKGVEETMLENQAQARSRKSFLCQVRDWGLGEQVSLEVGLF